MNAKVGLGDMAWLGRGRAGHPSFGWVSRLLAQRRHCEVCQECSLLGAEVVARFRAEELVAGENPKHGLELQDERDMKLKCNGGFKITSLGTIDIL